jgi:subtilase family serine protease
MKLLKSSKLFLLMATVGVSGQALYAQGAYPAVPPPAAPGTARPHVWIKQGPFSAVSDGGASANVSGICGIANSFGDYCPADMRSVLATNFIANANGGSGTTVYIVDAYDLASAAADLHQFSIDTGLPQLDGIGGDGTFTKATPFGVPISAVSQGWSIEESLDIEWVHAMAPKANIVLVEALSNSFADLFNAVQFAETFADVTSDSWGGGEFSGEIGLGDPILIAAHSPVLFSTGDSGAPGGYPAFSPWVTAVGGTTLRPNTFPAGYRISETGWSGSGGGISAFEPTPPYQFLNGVNFGARSIPDVALDADPNTGVLVLSFDDGGYFGVGGTSLACPMLAGFLADVDTARVAAGKAKLGPSFSVLNPELYSLGNSSLYHYSYFDVISGNNGFAAGPGYDLVTGWGDPSEPAMAYRLVTQIP